MMLENRASITSLSALVVNHCWACRSRVTIHVTAKVIHIVAFLSLSTFSSFQQISCNRFLLAPSYWNTFLPAPSPALQLIMKGSRSFPWSLANCAASSESFLGRSEVCKLKIYLSLLFPCLSSRYALPVNLPVRVCVMGGERERQRKRNNSKRNEDRFNVWRPEHKLFN